jgi:hypothetical protein
MASGAGVRRATWLHLAGADAQQMALGAQHPPQLAAHRRVGAPVPKAAAHASPAPLGFERGGVFPTNQAAVRQQGYQDQHIGGQVHEFAVAPFIFLPAGLDPSLKGRDPGLPAGEMARQRDVLLLVGLSGALDQQGIALFAGLEAVNFTAQTGLSAIQATGVQKHRTAHLAGRLVSLAHLQHADRDQRPDSLHGVPTPQG